MSKLNLVPPHDLLCDQFDNKKQPVKQKILFRESKSESNKYVDCSYSGMEIPIEDCKDIQSHSGEMFCTNCKNKGT